MEAKLVQKDYIISKLIYSNLHIYIVTPQYKSTRLWSVTIYAKGKESKNTRDYLFIELSMPHPKEKNRKRRCLPQIPMVQQYKIVGSHIYAILS